MIRSVTAFLVASAVLILGAGCGGSSVVQATTTTTTTKASSSTTSTTRNEGTTQSSGTSTTATFSGAGSEKYCNLARQYQDASKKLGEAISGGATPEQARQTVALLRSAIQQIPGVVPPELKADWDILLPVLAAFAKAIEDSGFDFTKLDPTSFQEFNTPAVSQAGERVTQYDQQVCNIAP